MDITDIVKLPETATLYQTITYYRNCLLHTLASRRVTSKHGALLQLCSDLGVQDAVLWDKNRFINEYPYSSMWYNLAFGI